MTAFYMFDRENNKEPGFLCFISKGTSRNATGLECLFVGRRGLLQVRASAKLRARWNKQASC